MHYNENTVDVHYEVLIIDKSTREVRQLQETHRMRYLFMAEIKALMSSNGIRFERADEWVTGKTPGRDTWGVCFVSIAHG